MSYRTLMVRAGFIREGTPRPIIRRSRALRTGKIRISSHVQNKIACLHEYAVARKHLTLPVGPVTLRNDEIGPTGNSRVQPT